MGVRRKVAIPESGRAVHTDAPGHLVLDLALTCVILAIPALAAVFVVWVLRGPWWLAIGLAGAIWGVGIGLGLLERLFGRGDQVELDFDARTLRVQKRRRDGSVRREQAIDFDDVVRAWIDRGDQAGGNLIVETRRQGSVVVHPTVHGFDDLTRTLRAIARQAPPLPVYRRAWFVALVVVATSAIIVGATWAIVWRLGWI